MLKVEYTGQFKRDYKLAIKRGFSPDDLSQVVSILVKEEPLPPRYKDHLLENSRDNKIVRECHIKPDWLLIYKVYDDRLILELIRTGTHSDLF